MVINVMLVKEKHVHQSFVALPWLHTTSVDCAHELLNRESGIKGEAGMTVHMGRLAKFSNINKRGVLNKVGEGGKKWNN